MRVVCIAVSSVDGRITRSDEPGTGFAGPADRAHFARILEEFDCCVMGAETYRVSRERILAALTPKRLRIVLTRDPNHHTAEAQPGLLEFSDRGPEEVIASLRSRGRLHCALLGGGQTHGRFFEAGLVTELWLTLEPRLFGNGTAFADRPLHTRLHLVSVENLNPDTLFLKYRVASAES